MKSEFVGTGTLMCLKLLAKMEKSVEWQEQKDISNLYDIIKEKIHAGFPVAHQPGVLDLKFGAAGYVYAVLKIL